MLNTFNRCERFIQENQKPISSSHNIYKIWSNNNFIFAICAYNPLVVFIDAIFLNDP